MPRLVLHAEQQRAARRIGECHPSLLLELALDVGDQRLALPVHPILRVEQRAAFFIA